MPRNHQIHFTAVDQFSGLDRLMIHQDRKTIQIDIFQKTVCIHAVFERIVATADNIDIVIHRALVIQDRDASLFEPRFKFILSKFLVSDLWLQIMIAVNIKHF
jgi:hypothetical protein